MENFLFSDTFCVESLWSEEQDLDPYDNVYFDNPIVENVPISVEGEYIPEVICGDELKNKDNIEVKRLCEISDHSDNLDEYSSSISLHDSEIVSTFDMTEDNKHTYSTDSNPTIKRKRSKNRLRWTEEEDEQLRALVVKYNKRNWKQIAKELGTNRLDTECRQHYCRVLDRSSTKGRWSFGEISKLIKAVATEADWNKVASVVKTRDRGQCILKWKQLNKVQEGGREWSHAEHSAMVDLYKLYPDDWQAIAYGIGHGLSADDVLQHYRHLVAYDCFK